ncbi:MAG: rhodanese-like domain-containing protein [Kouleothrix sp.]|nr:rhodanese-like domain-containing protein [Kouleothrix sp.]
MFGLFGRKPDSSDVTPEDVQRRQAAGEQLYILDVRERSEYVDGHIAGSTLIPLGELANRAASLPKDRPIVAVCHSGGRSSTALSVLKRAGFTNALNMKGGMIAWTRSGLPIKRGK